MWLKNWVIVFALAATLVAAQEESEGGPQVSEVSEEDVEAGPNAQEVAGVRKLRLRRPRPKIIAIDNEEGIAEGRPVPLKAGVPVDQLIEEQQSTADLLAAAVQGGEPSALESLLATAEGSGIEDVQQPILPVRPQPTQPPRRERPRQRVVGVPRRSRPRTRPQPAEQGRAAPSRESSREEGGNGRPRPEPIRTTERYSHMNSDGSFTFGYVSEDGSFREETKGVDCITRGKYGYIDPDGKRREFTYVSGLPCDTEDKQEFDQQGFPIDDDEDFVQNDPIDAADRFRQSAAVQLSDDEIPDSARRQPQRRPVERRPVQQFNNFQAQQPARAQPARPRQRPTPAARRPVQGGNALQNLLNIADGTPAPQQPARPAPTAPVQRPRPTPTRPRPTAGARPAFDFDSEVDSFTLNRPALTFQGNPEAPRTQNGAPAPANQAAVGPNFSSELVFDPASGTFKTELRQAIPGAGEITIADSAQPGARRPAPSPQPTPTAAPQPSPTPSIATFATTRGPTPSVNPTVAFQPLTFPSPASIQPSASPVPSSPTPSAPTTPVRPPTPTRAFVSATTPRAPTTPVRPAAPGSPTNPSNSFFFHPFPTIGSPRPVAPGQAATTIRPSFTIPAGTFNLNAGQVRPTVPQVLSVGQPRPTAPQVPQPPQIPGFPRPTPVTQPRPEQPRTAAVAPTAAAAPGQPQLQFGFSPIPQTQPRPVGSVQAVARPPPAQAGRPAPPQAGRPVPFTAFRNGLPPQQAGAPRPQLPQVGAPRPQQPQQVGAVRPQFQGQRIPVTQPQVPQQFQGQRPVFQQPFQIQRPGQPQGAFNPFTAFAQRPGQPQARPPPGFAVRPPPQGFQQRPEQFRTAGGQPARFAARPAGTPPGFSVFNPAALRGARF